ncbi:unnamed protein product [Porites evermanni]|uniref:Uncharacterized protein n=1 Tax=Porites evermanni TaxID=104178 RepID=A0ABN8R3B8_9CNID|nr:unnamed protein product [Porites evermanni]
MTDLSEQEINVVEKFSQVCTILYLCDFHREQAWEQWVSKAPNGVSDCKEEVLTHIRRVAHASSSPKYEDAVKALMASSV